jgi:uncharacterized protein (DUF433 family)
MVAERIKKNSVIQIDPNVLGGTPVFRGTRVPVKVLFDHLRLSSLEEFYFGYPQITSKMVEEVLFLMGEEFAA